MVPEHCEEQRFQVFLFYEQCVVSIEGAKMPERRRGEVITSRAGGTWPKGTLTWKNILSKPCCSLPIRVSQLVLVRKHHSIPYKTPFCEHSLKRKCLLVNNILTWLILSEMMDHILPITFPGRPAFPLTPEDELPNCLTLCMCKLSLQACRWFYGLFLRPCSLFLLEIYSAQTVSVMAVKFIGF